MFIFACHHHALVSGVPVCRSTKWRTCRDKGHWSDWCWFYVLLLSSSFVGLAITTINVKS